MLIQYLLYIHISIPSFQTCPEIIINQIRIWWTSQMYLKITVFRNFKVQNSKYFQIELNQLEFL